MSQALWVALGALEKRLDELEERLRAVEDNLTSSAPPSRTESPPVGPTESAPQGFRVVHHGFGRYKVEQDEAVAHSGWLNKKDAEAMAEELNAAIEGTEAA